MSDAQKWIVRDRTGSLPDREFCNKDQADAWVAYLFEWNTTARPTVIHPMSEWTNYRRKGLSEMRLYMPGEYLTYVSVSDADLTAGSPKVGDMIARNPKNHDDMWLVAKKYFDDNFEPVTGEQGGEVGK